MSFFFGLFLLKYFKGILGVRFKIIIWGRLEGLEEYVLESVWVDDLRSN